MRLRSLGIWVMLLALVTGCGGSAVFMDYNRDALRASYRSFDFMPEPAPSAMGPIAENAGNRDVIVSSIERNLRRRGLTQKSAGPDLLVAFYAGFKTRVDISYWGYTYAANDQYENGLVHPEFYDGGTIIIDLVDAKTKELVWRGWSKGIVNSPGKAENTIRETINKVMANYPPR